MNSLKFERKMIQDVLLQVNIFVFSKFSSNKQFDIEFSHDNLVSLDQFSMCKLEVTVKQIPKGICACL